MLYQKLMQFSIAEAMVPANVQTKIALAATSHLM